MPSELQLDVRLSGLPGIVDSDSLPIMGGMTVITGRNNVGKSRILTSIADIGRTNDKVSRRSTPEFSIKRDGVRVTVQVGDRGELLLYQVEATGD